MPTYDRACEPCGVTHLDVMERIDTPDPPCATCGTHMPRVWTQKVRAVVKDEIWLSVDHSAAVGTNPDGSPREFRSKAELKRTLAENGWQLDEDHVTAPGTDKNDHTTRWATGSKHAIEFDTPEARAQRRLEMAEWLGKTPEEYDAIVGAKGGVFLPNCPIEEAIYRAIREHGGRA